MPAHRFLSLFTALLLAVAPPLAAETFTVTRADDPLPPQCLPDDCSLRGAVMAAAITPGADLVLMPQGTFTLARYPLPVSGTLTVRGAGATRTSIVGTSADVAITAGALSELTLEGLRFTTGATTAIEVTDGRLALRDVDLPNTSNNVVVREESLSAALVVEASQLALVGCIGNTVACTLADSEVATFGIIGAQAALDARRILSVGNGASTGIHIASNARARIVDSIVSGHAVPLEVAASGADVRVERTRFVGNAGPMRGDGGGMVWLEDVEFRDNVVGNANLTRPAVLHATGTAWRINRALFVGNRGGAGGATLGAIVAADPGANVVMINTTFVDNTYRSGVSPTPAHAIGVRSTVADPTILWLLHATLRRPSSVAPNVPGSLLAVSGGGASVRFFNSVLDGTCAFANGGSVLQAVGSIESIGNTCGIAGSGNYVNVPPGQLGLGALADHGGFTRSVMPAAGSLAVGNADAT